MLFTGDAALQNVPHGALVEVSHMRPPLRFDRAPIHFVGSAELDEEERLLVKDFVDSQKRAVSALQLRQRIEQYVIHSSPEEICSDDTLPRFSCATYVVGAYEQADIELLDGDIPFKTIDDLKHLYTEPAILDVLDDPVHRDRIGIGVGTIWPIVLVGYLLHSLSRTPDQIRAKPYRPSVGDEIFPTNDVTGVRRG